MDIIDWVKLKVSNINSVLDVGIVITLLTGITVIITYVFKLTVLNIIGIPLSISLNFVSASTNDYVVAFFIIVLVAVLTIFEYQLVYKNKFKKKIKFFVIYLLLVIAGLSFAKSTIYDYIMVIMAFLGLAVIVHLFIIVINKRPLEIIHIIFKDRNEINKLMVTVIESIQIFTSILVVVTCIANLYMMMPVDKITLDNKLVICNKDNQYLVANYDTREKPSHTEIVLDMNSLEYITKEEMDVNSTGKCYFAR